jgi:hypothetical protein
MLFNNDPLCALMLVLLDAVVIQSRCCNGNEVARSLLFSSYSRNHRVQLVLVDLRGEIELIRNKCHKQAEPNRIQQSAASRQMAIHSDRFAFRVRC